MGTGSRYGIREVEVNCYYSPCTDISDLSQSFVLECDARGNGIGTVLMQGGRPIAHLNKAFSGKAIHYEKEMGGNYIGN